MIDLHTHILPHIDDGATSWEVSVAMCRKAAEDGCDVLVATPHQRHPHWWNDDLEDLETARRELQSRLGPHPRILLGGEVRADREILTAIDALASTPTIRRLAGSRYLLLEFGPSFGPQPETIVHEMRLAGWVPLLAHPECIPWLADDMSRLETLISLGALLQITAMSVCGDFGRGPRDAAMKLLDQGMVHVLASDCHNLDGRPPGLSRAVRVINRRFGQGLSDSITERNPRAIVEDREVAAA